MNNILIKNARIVDGTTDRAKDAVDIMLADGKVQDIGPSLTTSGDVTVIDTRDRFVMPGLIDAHVHVIAQQQLPSASVDAGHGVLGDVEDVSATAVVQQRACLAERCGRGGLGTWHANRGNLERPTREAWWPGACIMM